MIETAIAKDVGPHHLDIAWARAGNPEHPTVLLVMGIAAQLVHWPDGFLDALIARELHLVLFDNRDAGRSTHLTDAPPPNLPAVLGGDLSSASYTLSDMAADAVGLLDVLGIRAAHVVGASMGGATSSSRRRLMAMAVSRKARSGPARVPCTTAGSVGKSMSWPQQQALVDSGLTGIDRGLPFGAQHAESDCGCTAGCFSLNTGMSPSV